MFCSQCGNQIRNGDTFCFKCGNRVVSAPPANPVQQQPQQQAPAPPTYAAQPVAYAQAPSAQPTERVVWVFRADRKYSMFKMTPCYIVFMEDKAVLAYLTPALQKAESAKVSSEIKESNQGFFKGSAAMMRYWSEYYKKYYSMSTAAILAEDPTNVVLPYQAITEVLFKGFSETSSSDDNTSSVTHGKLNFEIAGGETLKFTHSQSADRSIQETLTRLFGNRLKYKR